MGVLNNPKWELFAREAAKGAKGATAHPKRMLLGGYRLQRRDAPQIIEDTPFKDVTAHFSPAPSA